MRLPRISIPRISGRLLGVLLLVAFGGCSDTTDPIYDGETMIVFQDPAGQLDALRPAIDAILDSTLVRVDAALDVPGVLITVVPGEGIAGYGIGGVTPNAHEVTLTINPAFPDLAALLPERLALILAHELHHAKRWRNPGYGGTLFEAMISEGLADHFAVELLDAVPPPWSGALTAVEVAEFLDRATPEFDSTQYNHAAWFFGTEAGIPRWTGYSVGYDLVARYQADHPEASAASLVAVSATVFRPASGQE